MNGRLYVCATPIGNLEDVTLRVLRILGEVDLIAAEDTRRTRKLLTHFQIKAKMISVFEHNERTQVPRILQRLQSGERVAMVTDAGTPAISDPGYLLISACIEAGIEVEVLPGPSSVVAALVVSGLPPSRFCFEGYLPRKGNEQRRRLEALAADDRTLVVFEAANRVRETIGNLQEIFGDRRAAVVRELTKIHEQVLRGKISEILGDLPEEIAGEVVLVVEGVAKGEDGSIAEAVELAGRLIMEGAAKSKAAAEAASRYRVPRRAVYDALLKNQNAREAGRS